MSELPIPKDTELKPTFLDLGWVVDEQLHPKYWVAHPNYWLESKDSDPKDSDMARIPTEDMDTHTVIIAQSGSGKSFFLGRLVEEIMLKSRSRCLILILMEILEIYTKLDLHYGTLCQVKILNQEYMI